MDLKDVVNGAVGAFNNNCAGYLNPGASGNGYIATLKLSLGEVKADMDKGLEGIVSYDRCEANDAYIGQINMLTASSFCGFNGAVWGYHLAKAQSIADGSIKPITVKKQYNGADVLVLPVDPLLDATYRLFGKEDQRRFNPLPGAMVVCANKSANSDGKNAGPIWCSIALAIIDDRAQGANLFIEDCDFSEPPADYENKMIDSILECGANQGVKYTTIFMGMKKLQAKAGSVACALTCAPYVTLARNAIPKGRDPEDLLDMTISQWEQELNLQPLPPLSSMGRPNRQ